MTYLSGLTIYPIKGCRGIDLEVMALDERGPAFDRRFMIVSPSGQFLTQREEPRLALIRPSISSRSLGLETQGMPSLDISLDSSVPDLNTMDVNVWRFEGAASLVSHEADEWLTEFLKRPSRLVRCSSSMEREANPEWAKSPTPIAFSDGYPILLISEASLGWLNQTIRAENPEVEAFGMARFRPNLVVSDCEAFAEDDWARVRIGDTEIDLVKPCDRCAVTTVNQETAERGREPLATLSRVRRSQQGVLFGQNALASKGDSLSVGSKIEILEAGRLANTPADWRVEAKSRV